MRVERLLYIIIYLINHEGATAKELADKFDVSVRTIQRDIDAIGLAGIPVTSERGNKGGYRILSSYKMENQYIQKDDFNIIIMALKSLRTGYESVKLDGILEKYNLMYGFDQPPILLDYGVTKEDASVQATLAVLERALEERMELQFLYRNVKNRQSNRRVRPIGLKFQWYAWYLFAFDLDKQENRMFKVSRIMDLTKTGVSYPKIKDGERIIHQMITAYLQTCEEIKLWCAKEDLNLIQEYFPDAHKETCQDNGYYIYLHVPANELLWQSLLLCLGNKITVLSPSYYRDMLVKKAKDFIGNHDIHLS